MYQTAQIEARPGGFFSTEVQPSDLPQPERLLLLAVMQQAVFDYLTGKAEFAEPASQWLFDSDDDYEGFSFPLVCEYLRLSPEMVRSSIRGLKRDYRPIKRPRRPRPLL